MSRMEKGREVRWAGGGGGASCEREEWDARGPEMRDVVGGRWLVGVLIIAGVEGEWERVRTGCRDH